MRQPWIGRMEVQSSLGAFFVLNVPKKIKAKQSKTKKNNQKIEIKKKKRHTEDTPGYLLPSLGRERGDIERKNFFF